MDKNKGLPSKTIADESPLQTGESSDGRGLMSLTLPTQIVAARYRGQIGVIIDQRAGLAIMDKSIID